VEKESKFATLFKKTDKTKTKTKKNSVKKEMKCGLTCLPKCGRYGNAKRHRKTVYTNVKNFHKG